MLLNLRSLVEATAENTASATYQVTVATGSGTVANPVAGTGTATYGVTVSTATGTVTNPHAQFTNAGVTYSKPRPKRKPEPVFTLPVPEAPTYRIYGNARATFDVLRVEGQGIVGKYVISGQAAASFAVARAEGNGKAYRRRVTGSGFSRTSVTRAEAHGVYDRSLWDQIEEEDQLLTDVLNVLSLVA